MKGRPKSLGHDIHIDAKRLYGCGKSFETSQQFRPSFSLSEPQIRREDKHGLVDCRMAQCKGEIGHRDILEGVSLSGRSVRRFPKAYRELLKTLECNRCNNRIPVLEM